MARIYNLDPGKYARLAIIPGNSLFYDLKALGPDEKTLFFMAEDKGLSTRFNYHKHKLILLFSAMRSYRDWLAEKFDIIYFEIENEEDSGNINSEIIDIPGAYEEKLLSVLDKYGIGKVVTYTFEDRDFADSISDVCSQKSIELETVDTPGFLTTIEEFHSYRNVKERLLMNNFYIFQRKRLGFLVDEYGEPSGGKWNLDAENRKSLPSSIEIPAVPSVNFTSHTRDVILLVDKLFSSNPGKVSGFYLPTTRKNALEWFDDFLEDRLRHFGPYEDAIKKDESFLFHSVISPLMNIGLLTPMEVVNKAIAYYNDNKDSIPLSSIEGFIRQIIGWREFMRGMYHGPDLRGNFFDHQRKLNEKWYDGTLGIEPVDCVIRKVVDKGYCHHIERLMVLGNFMLLCEIDPDEVYRWFMEMFVDSYRWVMEPNIYGMSQFADGGTLSTKPYVSGSAYILRMSDFKKSSWCDVWDALYWRFIDKNRDVLRKNFRMGMMVSVYDRMDEHKKNRLSVLADDFLDSL